MHPVKKAAAVSGRWSAGAPAPTAITRGLSRDAKVLAAMTGAHQPLVEGDGRAREVLV